MSGALMENQPLPPAWPIPRSAVPCPKCGCPYLVPGPWPWYLGTIGAMICKPRECTHCGHEFDYNKPLADFGKRKRNLAILINAIGGIGILMIIALVVVLILFAE